jgi:hypothetical protein
MYQLDKSDNGELNPTREITLIYSEADVKSNLTATSFSQSKKVGLGTKKLQAPKRGADK